MVEDNEAIIESWIASCETIEQLEHLIHIVYDRVQNEKVQSNLIELIHRKEKSLADGKRDINEITKKTKICKFF